MATLAQRDDADLAAGLGRWWAQRVPDANAVEVAQLDRPASGWSNEMLLATMRWQAGGSERRRRIVVRLPPPVPTFPSYDLAAQARVLDVLARSAVPVPRVVAFEEDAAWLGAPFLVMAHEAGRPGAEAPALDPWLVDAPHEQQRRLHRDFVTTLASIHRVDWRSDELASVLRGGDLSLGGEIAWWTAYLDWAHDGAPPPALADALAWCAATTPVSEPPASLCWGDARLGNVLCSDDYRITAVLDWELASIGPAEMDLAWYLVLSELTDRFTGRTVPGFLPRADLVSRYEDALGRCIVDLEWHEIFALTRSVAINERQARMAAAAGVPYPGVAGDENPVLRHLVRRIERFRP
jgi:aminoglycoside phosphotransferase (APT) family kinase protein